MNITDFVLNILRNDINQEVTGKWRIKKLILNGDFNGLINGLNLQNDVLHIGNPYALISGTKRIKELEVHDIHVSHINGIDMHEWMIQSVKINDNTTIHGHVTFKKFVGIDNNLRVYGVINGIPITHESVLMMNRENQVINGDVTFFIIDPKTPVINGKSNQVFIENLRLNGEINGRNWAGIAENLFRSYSDYIDSKVIFEKELKVMEVQTNKSIYGTNMVEFLKGTSVSNNMLKFKKNMERLAEVGDDLIRSLGDSVIELSHFEFVQTLNGADIQKTVLFSSRLANHIEYFLAVHEKNSTLEFITFYKWNRESNKFFLQPLFPVLHYPVEGYHVTYFYKIVYRGIDHLYIEFFDIHRNAYDDHLLVYDQQIGNVRHVIRSTGPVSTKFFTWMDGSSACYGLIHKFDNKAIINCDGMPQTIIQVDGGVKEISSLSDALIFLTVDGVVRIWHDQRLTIIPGIINPQSFTAIRYNEKYYLAVRTDEIEGTIHHGDIHIFESPVNGINFMEIQKLQLHVPTAIQFSKAPSGDLLLYVLTRNEPRAFFVYSYAGSSNFVSSIGEDTIIKKASDLDFIQIDGTTEMVSVVSGDNLYIIKAVLNEF